MNRQDDGTTSEGQGSCGDSQSLGWLTRTRKLPVWLARRGSSEPESCQWFRVAFRSGRPRSTGKRQLLPVDCQQMSSFGSSLTTAGIRGSARECRHGRPSHAISEVRRRLGTCKGAFVQLRVLLPSRLQLARETLKGPARVYTCSFWSRFQRRRPLTLSLAPSLPGPLRLLSDLSASLSRPDSEPLPVSGPSTAAARKGPPTDGADGRRWSEPLAVRRRRAAPPPSFGQSPLLCAGLCVGAPPHWQPACHWRGSRALAAGPASS